MTTKKPKLPTQEEWETFLRTQDDLREQLTRESGYARLYRQQVAGFDKILDEIVKTAQGTMGVNFYPTTNFAPLMTAGPCVHERPSEEERRELEVRGLYERVASTEAALAAVRAVATFAKEHKA